jgi:cobalamin biosynthesis Mg chelatase CobN
MKNTAAALHSTLAILLETRYQGKWQPDEGFIEGV